MNKEVISSIINVLKTLKNIFLRQNELMLKNSILKSEIEMKRLIYQHKRFNKITNDINSLMNKLLTRDEFEKYLKKSNKLFKKLLIEEKKNTTLVKKANEESLLMIRELLEKLMDFDYILDEIKDSLE